MFHLFFNIIYNINKCKTDILWFLPIYILLFLINANLLIGFNLYI